MTEAIFGLIGVVVGALAASLGDLALERRRETAGIRRAARLVHFELLEAYAVLAAAAVGEDEFPSTKDERLVTDAWEAYRGQLASAVSDETWSKLAVAYRVMGMLNSIASGRNRPLRRHLPVQDRDWLKSAAGDVRLALDALADLARFVEPDEELDTGPIVEAEGRGFVAGADAMAAPRRQRPSLELVRLRARL